MHTPETGTHRRPPLRLFAWPPTIRVLSALLLAILASVALLPASAVPARALQASDGRTEEPAADVARADTAEVPLYDDLGDLHVPARTSVPEAQEYFDQGMRLYYAFNHQEAIRSFRAAQRLDPHCALCFWGEALAWGPNINLPMDSASALAAYRAVSRASELASSAPARERDLVRTLSVRYTSDAPAERAHLDSAYARAMEELADRYPEDDDVQVLHGEARMDLRPWDYWTEEGTPAGGISAALDAFRTVMDRSPEHPGACHFFIHAVEQEHPARAVPCAERLASLMPGAGHLVHMPGHIYIRVGRYRDAVEANRHAVHADETWIRDQRPDGGMYTAGYYPHNYDFLAFAASMIGDGTTALDAADRLASLVPEEMLGAEGMAFLEHWLTRPLQLRVRFERWDDILDAPAPEEDLVHARGIWRYARGRALAATGRPDEAREELARLRPLAASPALEGLRGEFNELRKILRIAEDVLEGRVAEAEGDLDRAVAALERAVQREDALLYGEPPEWSVPVRQELGEVLLAAERFEEAARVFRADLDRFPENLRSTEGLERARRGAEG